MKDPSILHPPEFLNILKISGLLNHILLTKRCVSIMLLRNINILFGMYNGTRFIITKLEKHIIQMKIIKMSKI